MVNFFAPIQFQLGFVPSLILEPVPRSELVSELDRQAVSPPNDTTDGEVGGYNLEFRRYTDAAAFGSRDIASQKVHHLHTWQYCNYS